MYDLIEKDLKAYESPVLGYIFRFSFSVSVALLSYQPEILECFHTAK